MQKELHFQIPWPEKHIAQKEEYPKKKRVLQKCLAHKKTAAAVAAHTSDNCSMPAETIWKINIWTAHSNNSQMIVRHQTTRAVANNKKKLCAVKIAMKIIHLTNNKPTEEPIIKQQIDHVEKQNRCPRKTRE